MHAIHVWVYWRTFDVSYFHYQFFEIKLMFYLNY
jgi:hypothetical protein